MGAIRGLYRRGQLNFGRFIRVVVDQDGDTTPVYPPLYILPSSAPSTTAAEGDLYFDSTYGALMAYNGSSWVSASQVGKAPVETVTASSLAVTLADAGKIYLLNRAAGIAVTLPALAAADVGTFVEFIFVASVTSNTTTITAQTGDLLTGLVVGCDTDTSNAVFLDDPDGSDDLIATFNGGTQGGLVGTRLRFMATTETQWNVTGFNRQSGAVATIFS